MDVVIVVKVVSSVHVRAEHGDTNEISRCLGIAIQHGILGVISAFYEHHRKPIEDIITGEYMAVVDARVFFVSNHDIRSLSLPVWFSQPRLPLHAQARATAFPPHLTTSHSALQQASKKKRRKEETSH
jgi:hypothetical protein